MSRVLLVLPSNTYRAPDFLDAARRLGAEVVIASEQAQTLQREMGDRALVIDLEHPEAAASAIVERASRYPLDAVVAVDEQGVIPAALAAERLGLPHNPPEAVRRTRDKAAMRAAMAATGMAQPEVRLARPGSDVAALAREVGLPCVVKAPSLSASRGVIRADDASAAADAADRVRRIMSDAGLDAGAPVIVETYVPGVEVAVEGLLRDGDLETLAVFDKPDPLEGPYFEETIYVTPSRLTSGTQERVAAEVRRAVSAVGLREGPVHAELRIGSEQLWVLELAGRSIGGLCSRTLTFGLGVSLEELILRHALGRPVGRLLRGLEAAGVMMLPIPASGVLRAVGGREEALAVPGIVGLDVTATVGQPIRSYPEADRYLGFLFARGASPDEVEAALREGHRRLDVVIE